MNPTRILLLLAAALSLVRFSARAVNDIEPSKEFYTVVYAPKPIVLDGDLAEWSGVPVLADPKFAIPKGSGTGANPNYVLFEEYAGGTWTGPDDQTSAVQVVYDADNVYFGFVVTDDYHENAANSAWNGDSIQLMIASEDRSAQVALYNYALGGIEGAVGDIIVNHEAGPGGTEAVITRNTATKKTTYEIKLPKDSLGLASLKGGPKFGLGMAINDGDELTPGQRGWGGLGAHAIVFGKTPSETALFTLAKGNDIEPTKEYYTALRTTVPIVLDGSLSEWTGAPVLADPKFAVPKGSGTSDNPNYVLFEEYAGGTWTGPDDQTSAVQVVYDADNVYFGFVVTDDYHENAANSAWNGDSIQLMIASEDRTAQVALYNYALGGIEGAVGDIIVNHEAGPGGTEAVVTRDSTTKKTTYEIKLPVDALGLTAPLTVGTKFGLGMAINDGDELTPGQRGWGGLGAHAIVFGKTPAETALVTLGTTVTGGDVIFLSAVNPSISGFSFRASDKGAAIVDAASAKLTIDGTVVTLTSKKTGDATDFTYTPAAPFPPGSSHTYAIEVKDTLGSSATDQGTFVTVYYAVLTQRMQAVTFDASKPGFVWNVFQNEGFTPNSLATAEAALAGTLADVDGTLYTDNFADPSAVGAAIGAGVQKGNLVSFEIPGVINLSQTGGDDNGNFPADLAMPGIPGTGGLDDGIDAEIISFVELPAGLITLGVRSDDSFKSQAGFINVPADGILLGQRDGLVSDTTFVVSVKDAGVYPIRTIWQEVNGGAWIEIYSVKADGTKVLVNDLENGGLKAYRSGTAPATPTDFSLSIGIATGGAVEIQWTEPGVVLQEAATLGGAWTDLTTATSPYKPATAGAAAKYYRLKK